MIRTALLLGTALTTTRPLTGLAQQLKLSAEVGKAQFFEGEPIYLLVRLRNLGTDTAWVTFFGLGTLPFTMAVTRENGHPVQYGCRLSTSALGPTGGETLFHRALAS